MVVCGSALVLKAIHAFARYGTYVAAVADVLLAGWGRAAASGLHRASGPAEAWAKPGWPVLS